MLTMQTLLHIREMFLSKKERKEFEEKKVRMANKLVGWWGKAVNQFGPDSKDRTSQKIRYSLVSTVPGKFKGQKEAASNALAEFFERASKSDEMEHKIKFFPDKISVI